MQTIIGIVICIIVILYFITGFMNTYEGLEDKTSGSATTTSTTMQSSTIGTTKILPPTVAEANSRDAVAGLRTMIPSIVDNKKLYTSHIDNLLDLCDLSILDIINNKLPINDDKTYSSEAMRNLKHIVEFSKIKDALIGSQAYLDL